MEQNFKILVVEDDQLYRLSFVKELQKLGTVCAVEDSQAAFKILSQQKFDIAFLDINLQGRRSGLKILKEALAKGIYTVVMSFHDEREIIEATYELGCHDYFVKDSEFGRLLEVVQNFKNKLKDVRFDSFINNSYFTRDPETIADLKDLLSRNTFNKSILILGPTGIGKTKIAQEIHKITLGDSKPFIDVNCSAIPESLLESEFFGHVKGSFTGATANKKGKLEEAHGGTLFLDEIGTMPINIQHKLLKALDEKRFTPVGASNVIQCEFRIISATWEDLAQMLQKEKFRPDLLSRLEGIKLRLKPLDERKDDIPLLIEQMIKRHSKKSMIIKKEAMEYLKNYSWPKNVRELEQFVQNLSDRGVGLVRTTDLPDYILENRAEKGKSVNGWLENHHFDFIQSKGLKIFLDEIRDQAVTGVLKRNKQQINKTVRDLKISKSSFYNAYLKLYNKEEIDE